MAIHVDITPGSLRCRRDPDGTRTYTANYVIINAGPVLPAIVPGLPLQGQSFAIKHGSDALAICKSVELGREEIAAGEFVWRAGVTWDTKIETRDRQSRRENPDQSPLDRSPVIAWQTRRYEECRTIDIKGKPLVNSAGDPFDPPMRVQRRILCCTIKRNEAAFDSYWMGYYTGRVNDRAWNDFRTGEVLIDEISAVEQYEKQVPYWEVTYRLEVNRDLWVPTKAADMGHRVWQLVAGQWVLKTATDDYANPVSRPVLLDGAGMQLQVGRGGAGEEPVALHFTFYESANFAALDLPAI